MPNVRGKATKRTKFDDRKVGPFKISRVIRDGRAYELDLGKEQRFHNVMPISRLEPYRRSQRYSAAHEQPPPLTMHDEEGEEVTEVDCIVADRKRRGRVQYKVRWLGFDSSRDEWMDSAQLANSADILQDYLDAKANLLFHSTSRSSARQTGETIDTSNTKYDVTEWYIGVNGIEHPGGFG